MAEELSLFLDESGSDAMDAKYYILTVVMHDQAIPINDAIGRYEQALRDKGLPDVPFHASPLMNGKDDYAGMDMGSRKKLLSSFRVFFRHLPISYFCIALKTKECGSLGAAENAMRKRLVNAIFDNLPLFQSFDSIKIYYDNGQRSMASALHKAIDYALSKNAVIYKAADPATYRLSQVADYLCTIELTARKYEDRDTTSTDEKVFGSWSMFKKGVLKEARAKENGPRGLRG